MHAVLGRVGGTKSYGVLTFGLAIATVLASVAPLGWPTATMRYLATYREQGASDLIHGIAIRAEQIVTGISLLVAAGVACAALATSGSTRMSMLVAAACLPFLAIDTLRAKAFQGLHRIAASLVPRNLVLPLVVVLLATLARAHGYLVPWTYVAGLAVAYVVARVWLGFVVGAHAGRATPRFETRTWMSVAFPMAFGGLGQMLMNRTGQILVGGMLGARAAGQYGAAERIAGITVFFLGATNLIAAPLIAGAYHAGRRREARAIVRTAMLWCTAVTIPIAAPALLFPKLLLGLFGPDFLAAATILRVLVAGQLVNAVTGPVGFALNLTGHERLFAALNLSAAIVAICGGLVLVPREGALGAAIATALVVSILNVAMLILAIGPHGALYDKRSLGEDA